MLEQLTPLDHYPDLEQKLEDDWRPNKEDLKQAIENCSSIDELKDELNDKAVQVTFKDSKTAKALIYDNTDEFFTAEFGPQNIGPVPVRWKLLEREIDECIKNHEIPNGLSNAGGKFEEKIISLLKAELSEG